MKVLSGAKNYLLQLGPNSRALHMAFRLQAALHGISIKMTGESISLTSPGKEMILNRRNLICVPLAVHEWKSFFTTLEGEERDGRTVLDFSRPGLHRYRRGGLSFYFPSMAEDDSMDAYTASYQPKEGDVVWDVGAHAGMSAYYLAQMVGPTGKVVAFEPDASNFEFLERNIEMHQLSNVTPVKAALSDTTGTAMFFMDGTMSAGLSDYISYTAAAKSVEVQTLSLRDACEQFGGAPNFIKMDIEGAELTVIESSLDFLKDHGIHLSIESNHLVNGALTSGPLDALLNKAGYRAWSSDEFGERFTWAQPPQYARS
jgi:FkbM family methyltransferase